ncbi:MAG TPA: tetratricopeptide repeat protein [Thermoanaerobaculia bacterium]
MDARELTAYIEWLSAGREAGEQAASSLARLSERSWEAWFRDTPPARTPHTLEALLDAAHLLLTRDPRRALALTGFVLAHLDDVAFPPFALLGPVMLRGRTWKERGNALLKMDDVRNALIAFETAAAIYATEAAARPELAAATRGAALARHLLGESERALELIREGAEVFAAHGEVREQAVSRLYEGVIHFDSGRYENAARLFREALEHALAVGDAELVAQLHNNLGHCAELLQDREAARAHLTRALALFEEHDMVAERPRAILGLAQVLADEGLLARAIAELEEVQRMFLTSGRHLQAAGTALDIVELLILTGNEDGIYDRVSEMVRVFAEAGVVREAMRALSFVRSVAGRGTLRADDVSREWAVIRGVSAPGRESTPSA